MANSWFIILGALLVSFFLTVVLWRKGFLKIFRKPHEGFGPSAMGEFAEGKAIFKLNKILEAEIPKWMAKPPLSYAICFLIVCIGIAVIILAINVLL